MIGGEHRVAIEKQKRVAGGETLARRKPSWGSVVNATGNGARRAKSEMISTVVASEPSSATTTSNRPSTPSWRAIDSSTRARCLGFW